MVRYDLRLTHPTILRKATPYTQRQVADLLGITESNYRKLENSRIKSISLDTIDFLCTPLSDRAKTLTTKKFVKFCNKRVNSAKNL